MTKIPISVSWSGGKDSSLMLYHLLQDNRYEVVELHTGISEETGRVSLHGISRELIAAQAQSIGIPLVFIEIPADSSNLSYETKLTAYFSDIRSRNIYHVAYGDIFLEDLKIYRDKLLTQSEISGIYPLWQKDTTELVNQFLDLGFQTMICAAKKELYESSICGKVMNRDFVLNLPPTVDPCGENGEFHTFAFDGPIFKKAIVCNQLPTIERSYQYQVDNQNLEVVFEFADLVLAQVK
ncbi:diphthine--ammonia ligase [Reichenbachiella agarivorans]|uniref:Diphthine--ammonia ligase n=1 Tax=Reichenbachiella agarivorans TaxID=2979464 RepID=A0ABY6CKJ2_9BACT|nr:diphthine--ammonia ligase [Reichenbachiella agarivorans]UXP31041.1 diphthine--ammonia ligase [Reichenbachiella agarivorans]